MPEPLAPQPHAPRARLVRVTGLVQGVGFRESVRRHARAVGAGGWVRNRVDGSVEMLLVADGATLDAFCAWLTAGVPAARVARVEAVEVAVPVPRPERLEILPTA